jgi:ATP/ADP translocase
MLAPAAVLYLSFAFAITARESATKHYFTLTVLSTISLILFPVAQLAGGCYLQGLLSPRTSRAGKLLQYLVVVSTSTLFSICAAMILAALGFTLLVRARR